MKLTISHGTASSLRRPGDATLPTPDAEETMLPVPRDPGCVVCGGPVRNRSWSQAPLLFHGGYGEAVRTEVEACQVGGCGQVRTVATRAVNPRSLRVGVGRRGAGLDEQRVA